MYPENSRLQSSRCKSSANSQYWKKIGQEGGERFVESHFSVPRAAIGGEGGLRVLIFHNPLVLPPAEHSSITQNEANTNAMAAPGRSSDCDAKRYCFVTGPRWWATMCCWRVVSSFSCQKLRVAGQEVSSIQSFGYCCTAHTRLFL